MRIIKRFIAFLIILILIFSVGCSALTGRDGDEPPMAKIQKMFTQMTSYKATCNITFITNNTQNDFKIVQYSRMTGEYRFEVLEPERLRDTVTVCDGKNIVQIDNRVGGKVYIAKPSQIRNIILLNSFVKNYLQGEDVMITTSNEMDNVTELEAVIPGNIRHLSTQKLWVDNETIKPIKMTIYDEEGKEIIIVQFEDFEYNIELSDDLFKIPEVSNQ